MLELVLCAPGTVEKARKMNWVGSGMLVMNPLGSPLPSRKLPVAVRVLVSDLLVVVVSVDVAGLPLVVGVFVFWLRTVGDETERLWLLVVLVVGSDDADSVFDVSAGCKVPEKDAAELDREDKVDAENDAESDAAPLLKLLGPVVTPVSAAAEDVTDPGASESGMLVAVEIGVVDTPGSSSSSRDDEEEEGIEGRFSFVEPALAAADAADVTTELPLLFTPGPTPPPAREVVAEPPFAAVSLTEIPPLAPDEGVTLDIEDEIVSGGGVCGRLLLAPGTGTLV